MRRASRWNINWTVAIALGLFCAPLWSQSTWQPGHEGIGFAHAKGKQWVQLVSSPQIAVQNSGANGSTSEAALRFVIQTGLHINSHTPRSKFYIPTTLTLSPSRGVEISKIVYPSGVDYHLAFDPKDALNVYTGEFGLLVYLHASPGQHVVHGQLRYQACDNRACNPPKTLPLTLDITSSR